MLTFFALCGASALLSLVLPAARVPHAFAWLGALASLVLVAAGGMGLLHGAGFVAPLWTLPGLATTLTLKLDPLAATFVLVTGLVLFPASLFAAGELRRAGDHNARAFGVMTFSLYAAIVLIYVAGDAVTFLLAWEAMSILSYLLIVWRHERRNGDARAGYLLLAMGEAGTLMAALSFLLLGVASGSFDFGAMKTAASQVTPPVAWAVFLLSFFGFGVKAGLVPVNSWLPRAYAAAPRAFVPILAGATLNLGLYGILRVNADLLPATHPGVGLVALVIGSVSALVGILYATTDNDLKFMLAHSSIENAGIVVAGLGAGMVFVATAHPTLAAIAFVAALYHAVNHALYKTLLFFGAGNVESQAGTRDMDRLGGLIKPMPLTALGFLLGALSIAAMPPFNGFVSEWLTLQTLLRAAALPSVGMKIVFALCGAALALTAALAVTCFVKAFATSFLGMRRLEREQSVTEAKSTALVPIFVLAALCVAFGVLPTYVIPALDAAARPLTGASASTTLVPPFFATNPSQGSLPPDFVRDFHAIGAQVGQAVLPGRGLVVLHRGGADNPVVFAMSTSYMALTLAVLLGLTYVIVRLWLTRRRRLARRERWDGGLRRLLPEMTYTATGFSNPVRVIFDAVFRPTTVEDTRETVAQHFRTAIRREKDRPHLVDRLVFDPTRLFVMGCARTLAAMHHGRFNIYAAYLLLVLVVTLLLSLFA